MKVDLLLAKSESLDRELSDAWSQDRTPQKERALIGFEGESQERSHQREHRSRCPSLGSAGHFVRNGGFSLAFSKATKEFWKTEVRSAFQDLDQS